MLRVGFLFNHYFPHQVPHAAPYAFELSRCYPDIEVIVACSSQQEMDLVETIGALYPGHRCKFKMLTVPWYYRIIDPVVSSGSLGARGSFCDIISIFSGDWTPSYRLRSNVRTCVKNTD